MNVKILAWVGMRDSSTSNLLTFDFSYEKTTTIKDLRYRLLAEVRGQFDEAIKKEFTVIEDLHHIYDFSHPQTVYQDDELVSSCVSKNNSDNDNFNQGFNLIYRTRHNETDTFHIGTKPKIVLTNTDEKPRKNRSNKQSRNNNTELFRVKKSSEVKGGSSEKKKRSGEPLESKPKRIKK